MDENASWKGKYLCLVLHSPEWGRKNQAVVVAFEFRAVIMSLRMSVLLS
jgi:hypothetical protein